MKDKCRNAPCVANLLGIVFLVVAVLGYTHNPLVGKHAFFVTNSAHNILHAVVGLALLASAQLKQSKNTLLVVGMIYVLLAIIGYAAMKDKLLGVFMVNMADHYLHLALGLVIIAAGVYVKDDSVKKKSKK